jgi:hypothetical protein
VIHGDGRRVAPSSMGLRVIGAKINKANARHLVAYLYPQTTTWCTVHAHGALGVEAARIQHVDEHLIPGYHRQRVRFGGSRLVQFFVPRRAAPTLDSSTHSRRSTARHGGDSAALPLSTRCGRSWWIQRMDGRTRVVRTNTFTGARLLERGYN